MSPDTFLEKLIVAAQAVTAGTPLSSPNAGLADVSGTSYLLVDFTLTGVSGSPTSVTLTITENDTNVASGQSDTTFALAFTGADIAIGKSRALAVRTRGLKKFVGLKVSVVAGTSATIHASVFGVVAHDSTELSPLSTVVSRAVLA